MPPVNVVLNFSKVARCAFNVLVGALQAYIQDADLSITVASDKQDLLRILQQADDETSYVVLWSFYSPRFIDAQKQLQHLKSRVDKTNIIHLAGGVHASAEPYQTLQAGFDYVAIGEGEQIIVDFIRCVLKGDKPNAVKGIAWLKGEQLQRNGRGELIDLNDYPPFAPNRRLFGAIEITRGCIYACKFCQTPYVSKARFRHRSVENIEYYAGLMRSRGFRDYRFITPTAFSYGSQDKQVNLDALENLLVAVRRAVGPEARIFYGTFPSEIRPEHVSRKALRMLKKHIDNNNLIIGGQSGSQQILDSSKRGHSVAAVTEAVKLCISEGFIPNVDFLYGLPGETEVDVEQTLSLSQSLAELGARIHNHTFLPLPGTPFRNSAAGDIDAGIQRKLVLMESNGQAYGKWKGQIMTARKLVEIRDSDQNKKAETS